VHDQNRFAAALDSLEPLGKGLGVSLNASQWQQLARFLSSLADYNSHTNLVAKGDPESLAKDHVLDSLTLVPYIGRSARGRLIDIGAGGGFPGIVLAIAMPEMAVTLVDSVGKKTSFLTQVLSELDMSQRVTVLTARAEEVGHREDYRNKFDFATARAVGRFDMVCELALPLIKVGGEVLLQKSARQAREDEAAAAACLPKLGGELLATEIPDSQILGKDVVIMRIKSVRPADGKYPRPWPKIKSSPLC